MMKQKRDLRLTERQPTEVAVTCRPFTSSGVDTITDGVMVNFSNQGSYVEAREKFKAGLILSRDNGIKWLFTVSFEGLAGCAAADREYQRASILLGAAEQLRYTLGSSPPHDQVIIVERTLESVHQALGENELDAARERGKAMEIDAAVQFALGNESSTEEVS